MTPRGYPDGADITWVAIDRNGYVAAFFSAGCAPIPRSWLERQDAELADLETQLPNLPRRGDLVRTGGFGPDDSYELAIRGCYVFDWSDVHRMSDHLRAYELCAMPSVPITLGDLKLDARMALGLVTFGNVEFGSSGVLDVEAHTECLRESVHPGTDSPRTPIEAPPAQHRPLAPRRTGLLSSVRSRLRRMLGN